MASRRDCLKTAILQGTAIAGGVCFPFQNIWAKSSDEVDFTGTSAEALQQELFRQSPAGGKVRLQAGQTLTCHVREDMVSNEKSIHALLVPEGVQLDLNGGTLLLDLRSNSYGVRLDNRSSIRNGTIRVIRSQGKGSQGCWHSGISVGAAYGDGGTPESPSHFSKISNWSIENVTLDQQVDACAIQLMAEACHGSIRKVKILDSAAALLGIGMDWGSVGPITSEDRQLPRMHELWKQKQLYSTHPHDITVENIHIGKLTRNIDANDAGIRCSACHRVTIRNVEIDGAASAVAIWGGDCGYEYARPEDEAAAHSGYHIENVRIKQAYRFGIVLNGTADNVVRAQRNHGYSPRLDPVHPGLFQPVLQEIQLTACTQSHSQGLYAVAVSGAQLKRVTIEGFGIGVHVEDWVADMHFHNCMIHGNQKNILIQGATKPATRVTFDPPN